MRACEKLSRRRPHAGQVGLERFGGFVGKRIPEAGRTNPVDAEAAEVVAQLAPRGERPDLAPKIEPEGTNGAIRARAAASSPRANARSRSRARRPSAPLGASAPKAELQTAPDDTEGASRFFEERLRGAV